VSFFDNLSQFHFLRPLWLSGLVLLPLIWLIFKHKAQAASDWSHAIAPNLLKHLMPTQQTQAKQRTVFSLLLLIAFSFISMSGPSWQEKPQPVVKISDDMVVILDLSLSMLATDTSPNRLTKAKQKLQDLLALRTEGNTALIAFSGDSHVVTPLTDDTKTIIANLPALDPFIMPEIGSRPDIAIEQAIKLLEQGKANKGRIVLLTDGVEEDQVPKINDLISQSQARLYILVAGTKEGGPIDIPGRGYFKNNEKVVIPKTNFKLLNTLALDNRGKMHAMSLDDQDLEYLDISGINLVQQAHADNSQSVIDKRYDAWEDMGYLLLIFIIPLALLAHRQSALLLITLCFILPTEKSYAFGLDDLWQTRDQQAQALLDQGKTIEAAERFESPEHKAFAHYKSKQFEQSQQHYGELNSADSLYNQANALAQQQKFEAAIKLYNQALKKSPAHEDSLHNKSLIEDFLKQQEQQNEDQQNQDQQNQDLQNQDQQNQDQQNQDQQNQDQQNQDQQNQDQQNQDQQNQDQQNQDQQNQDQQNQDQQNQDQQNQDQQNQDQQEQDQQDQDQQDQDQQEKEQQAQSAEDEKKREDALNKEMQAIKAQAEQLSDEEKQSYEQWMRRVPDDPGGLLRRKFERQSNDRNRKRTRKEGDPIW